MSTFEHPDNNVSLPSASECRAFARLFDSKAREAGLPARTATIMKNIARSLSALASQLEMLAEAPGKES